MVEFKEKTPIYSVIKITQKMPAATCFKHHNIVNAS